MKLISTRNISIGILVACLLAFGISRYILSGQKNKELTAVQTIIEKKFLVDSTEIGLSTIISNLEVPWEIAWGPDNWIWFTEQKGQISKVNPATGERKILLKIADVWHERTAGLLGMALHPNMKKFPYVVVDYTYRQDTTILSRLVRYTAAGDTLINPVVLLEIPGNTAHNGSRVTIGPDGKIFWATGDAVHSERAQDTKFLNGKILRLNIDGSIPKDNPIDKSAVWAFGYRNIQGLVYASNGVLYTSEHGDATDDEVNLITKGGNYGWPDVTGFYDTPAEQAYNRKKSIIEPLKAWTPTIAPAGITYYGSDAIPEWQNSLLLTTLKAQSLRILKLDRAGKTIISERIFFNKVLGRLRSVCVSPDGDVYIGTSNRDWNPPKDFPKKSDDRIVRVFRIKPGDKLSPAYINLQQHMDSLGTPKEEIASGGELIYNQYCLSCHKQDGKGIAGTFPPLRGTKQVVGNKRELIRILLNGLSGPIKVNGKEYNQQMPAFNFLSDTEIAEVLTYIRSEFDNKAAAITANEVRFERF
jgi:glucose/arabinose dehydrogenase/mono/diheme cytochrome c family protein